MQFGGQTSKNIHDSQKVCLEMCLCVIVCFVKFYVFLLVEIDVRGLRHVHKHIRVRNVWEKLPKEQPRG